MNELTTEDITLLNRAILGRKVTPAQAQKALKKVESGRITVGQYLLELMFSTHFLRHAQKNILELHSHFIHYARIKAVASLLPEAKIIVDLGGANCDLQEMGYPYKFERLIVVDLPARQRIDMYKHLKMRSRKTRNGIIETHYGDMSDLKFLKANSVDLVWAGEAIEHISERAGRRMIKEAFRVLKPGGYFCLDTPNRLITEIHTSWRGGDFIHPEHKIEYYPEKLQSEIHKAGFEIIESRGICEMKNTSKTKSFDYRDFVYGNPLSSDVDSSYIQFYKCHKPLRQERKAEPKKSPVTQRLFPKKRLI